MLEIQSYLDFVNKLNLSTGSLKWNWLQIGQWNWLQIVKTTDRIFKTTQTYWEFKVIINKNINFTLYFLLFLTDRRQAPLFNRSHGGHL